MTETLPAAKPQRLMSLDILRGLTIAGMILVNNPGSWGSTYSPLLHAQWNGCTPTDLVFPFFLFIVGAAMPFSFDKRLASGHSRLRLFEHVVRRSVILFALGLTIYSFSNGIWSQGKIDWRLMAPYIGVIVGLSMLFMHEPPLSFPSGGKALFLKIAGICLTLGAIIYWFVDLQYFHERGLRVPGVLQRIAVCYFFASLILMFFRQRGRLIVTGLLLISYCAITAGFSAPSDFIVENCPPDGLLHHWIDVTILGEEHLYSHSPDPEGILSTITSLASVMIGVLVGMFLNSRRDNTSKAIGMFEAAAILLFAGYCMDFYNPWNKKIWTASYVIWTAGLALLILATVFVWVDIRGWKKWSTPFMIFGSNAITVYFLSSIGAIALVKLITVPGANGEAIPLKTAIVDWFNTFMSPMNASLTWALSYIIIWCLLMTPLYVKKIFIKV